MTCADILRICSVIWSISRWCRITYSRIMPWRG